MNPEEQERASRLGRTWDDLATGKDSAGAEPGLLADVQFVQEVTAVPPPPPRLQSAIWRQVSGRSLASTMSAIAVSPSPNGVAKQDLAPELTTRSINARTFDWIGMCRILAIGMIAGFAAGFASGLWVRIAMRISGSLTSDRNRGLLTEADAVVGQLTVAGTLSIAMFAATLGIVGGLMYLAARRWLPRRATLRAISFGVLLFAVFGFFVMDENNPDYQLFGPTLLSVGTFSLTYVVFGILVSVFVERLDSRLPRPRLGRATQARVGALVPIGAIAIAMVAGAGVAIAAAAVAVALLFIVCVRWLIARVSWRLDTNSPAFVRVSACSLIVPGLFGFFLTVQGIVAILAG